MTWVNILDTVSGKPAECIEVELWYVEGDKKHKIFAATTNQDGRTEKPLAENEMFKNGKYELIFFINDYFNNSSNPNFLDTIPIHFGVSDNNNHYHVPLLLSPFGY